MSDIQGSSKEQLLKKADQLDLYAGKNWYFNPQEYPWVAQQLRALAAYSSGEPPAGPYTIEPHGDGYALYSGRDHQHHGFNLARITEAGSDVLKLIERALNTSSQPPGDDARLAIEELKNIINARRRDRDNFADDTEFADWVLSRARYTLGVIERASETKCAVCNDTGSVQDSEVPYLGNPCPECK